MIKTRLEPSSFRDSTGTVFYIEGEEDVFRAVQGEFVQDWVNIKASKVFIKSILDGKLVRSEEASLDSAPRSLRNNKWGLVLRHERIPFISYPYEWGFEMIRSAAVLYLEFLLEALDDGYILKDASAYNVQWKGVKPVFIDLLSLQKVAPGEIWYGYEQFCEMFLNPLLLQAYKGVSFRPWLRGRLNGIEVTEMSRLFGISDWLKPGIFKHVYLHSLVSRRYENSQVNMKIEFASAGFHKELVIHNVRGLLKLVKNLKSAHRSSHWELYAQVNSYTEAQLMQKREFVEAQCNIKRKVVWDFGCNTGTFSRIAAVNAEYVLALDSEPEVIDRLFLALQKESEFKNILPLVMDLSDPSPRSGWRCEERSGLQDRGRPDLILSLALIHHMVIGANIPMSEVIAWFAGLGADLIIEFVSTADPMVEKLCRNRRGNPEDYSQDSFEHEIGKFYRIEKKQILIGELRTMYFCTRLGN